jgi:hypothetical protein
LSFDHALQVSWPGDAAIDLIGVKPAVREDRTRRIARGQLCVSDTARAI